MENQTYSPGGGITVQLALTETVDAVNNTSVVSILPQMKSVTYNGVGYWVGGTIKANGNTVFTANTALGGHYFEIQNRGNSYHDILTASGYAPPPYSSGTILHDADGYGTLRLEIKLNFIRFGTSSAPSSFSFNKTVDLPLTTIPRSATAVCNDTAIENTAQITINRRNAAYLHSVAYSFGSLSGYINANGQMVAQEVKMDAVTLSVALPSSWYQQIPNAKSGTVTLTVRTYSGSALIGTPQVSTFLAIASEARCAPTLTASVTDTNNTTKTLTGNNQKLVRYASTARAVATATAKNSATISSVTINGVSGATQDFANVEIDTFVFVAVDSRGYTVTQTITPTIVPYFPPTCNPLLRRPAPSSNQVLADVTGEFFNGSFGSQSNSVTLSARAKEQGAQSWGNWQNITNPTVSGNAYTLVNGSLGNVFLYTSAYDFEIRATDKIGNAVTSASVFRGIPIFDWGKDDFNFNVPVNVPELDVNGETVDLPVASGTASPWKWVRYASGRVELIGKLDLTSIQCNQTLLAGFVRTDSITPPNFPFTVNDGITFFGWENSGYGAFIWQTQKTLTTRPPALYLTRPGNATTLTGTLVFHVYGTYGGETVG